MAPLNVGVKYLLNSQQLSFALRGCVEIRYAGALWVRGANLEIKAKNDWQDEATSSGNTSTIYSR